ncbi:MAG: YkuS family protein [Peptococcaceae bacterium]|nr:YkuS family protein [Peptococcaceae bacterium]
MGKKIAVQENLVDIKERLKTEGYEIIDPDNPEGAEAFVITTGIEEDDKGDLAGTRTYLPTGQEYFEFQGYAPVVDATGKSPEQVVDEIRRLAKD